MRYLLSTILLVLLLSNSSTAQDQPTIVEDISKFHIATLCRAQDYKYDYYKDHHRIWIENAVVHAFITENNNLSLETTIRETVDLSEINFFNAEQQYVKAVKVKDKTVITSTVICKGVTFDHINLLLRLQAVSARTFVEDYID
jgi:hypothetical protein